MLLGWKKIRNMVNGPPIMPTPGAVMEASKLLYNEIGDLITIDVGGATTDIHSVTEGSDEINRILINPEPLAKRTVEGDLGVFVNMHNILDMVGKEEIFKELNISLEELEKIIENHKEIPDSDLEKEFVEKLTFYAFDTALNRHAGRLRNLYGPSGKKTLAEGKDLTQVQTIIGTGGALTRLSGGIEILKKILV